MECGYICCQETYSSVLDVFKLKQFSQIIFRTLWKSVVSSTSLGSQEDGKKAMFFLLK